MYRLHNLFFEANRQERIKNEIIALLAGDLWQENNSFQEGLLAGRYAAPKIFNNNL